MYRTVDKTIYKQAFNPENLIRCWNECLDTSSFHNRRMQVEEFNKKNYWKKRGIAVIPMKFSVGFVATSYHQVKLVCVGGSPPVGHIWLWPGETVTFPRGTEPLPQHLGEVSSPPPASTFNTVQQKNTSMAENSIRKHESHSSKTAEMGHWPHWTPQETGNRSRNFLWLSDSCDPVVKAPCFQCWGTRFDPRWGN